MLDGHNCRTDRTTAVVASESVTAPSRTSVVLDATTSLAVALACAGDGGGKNDFHDDDNDTKLYLVDGLCRVLTKDTAYDTVTTWSDYQPRPLLDNDEDDTVLSWESYINGSVGDNGVVLEDSESVVVERGEGFTLTSSSRKGQIEVFLNEVLKQEQEEEPATENAQGTEPETNHGDNERPKHRFSWKIPRRISSKKLLQTIRNHLMRALATQTKELADESPPQSPPVVVRNSLVVLSNPGMATEYVNDTGTVLTRMPSLFQTEGDGSDQDDDEATEAWGSSSLAAEALRIHQQHTPANLAGFEVHRISTKYITITNEEPPPMVSLDEEEEEDSCGSVDIGSIHMSEEVSSVNDDVLPGQKQTASQQQQDESSVPKTEGVEIHRIATNYLTILDPSIVTPPPPPSRAPSSSSKNDAFWGVQLLRGGTYGEAMESRALNHLATRTLDSAVFGSAHRMPSYNDRSETSLGSVSLSPKPVSFFEVLNNQTTGSEPHPEPMGNDKAAEPTEAAAEDLLEPRKAMEQEVRELVSNQLRDHPLELEGGGFDTSSGDGSSTDFEVECTLQAPYEMHRNTDIGE